MTTPYFDALPRVQQAHEEARDELRRADTKATTLLSLVGAALAGVLALTTRQVSPVATAAIWAAATPIFVSVLVLLSAIRPRLAQFPTPGSWLDAAFNGPGVLLEAESSAAATVLAADVVLLAGVAVTKYQRVSRSVALLVVGLSLLAVALVLAVLT